MSDVKNSDRIINEYIINHHGENYDDIISEDSDWNVFYHFSEMRKALFNWYDFGEEADLLEVGGGFGALTGLFCDKCNYVVSIEKVQLRADAIKKRYSARTNLTVVCDDVLKWKSDCKFDFIIIAGLLETLNHGSDKNDEYAKILKTLSDFLKRDGKIILAVENRFGIRYFCGAVDKHTGRPYSGINNYPYHSEGRSFDKQQIKAIISDAGLENCKFYYPLPDYVLPQVIYSEDYLPVSSIRERVIPYYLNKEYLTAYENDLYDDLVKNNVFEFFSNSFLIECSRQDNMGNIIYAALSTDRGSENGFATVIRNTGMVQKKALYSEGIKSLHNIQKNIQELMRNGIHCVEHCLVQNRIEMPFIQKKTLNDELRQIIFRNSNKFRRIIDGLYECIIKSSKTVDINKNELPHEGISNDKFGVILDKAYIDMIPINCFYIDNEFYFFDQEFVRRNFPAKYVLYRVLKYTYFFIPKAEEIVPLEDLKGNYELKEVWDCFEAEEKRFVASNRKYDVYQHFRKWAAVNKNEIFKRNEGLL